MTDAELVIKFHVLAGSVGNDERLAIMKPAPRVADTAKKVSDPEAALVADNLPGA